MKIQKKVNSVTEIFEGLDETGRQVVYKGLLALDIETLHQRPKDLLELLSEHFKSAKEG